MGNHKLEHHFFLLLLIVVGVVIFFVFKPFLSPIFLAFAFATVFKPVHQRMKIWLRGRDTFSALLTIVFITVVILIPLTFLGGILFTRATNLYLSVANNGGSEGLLSRSVVTVENFIKGIVPNVTIDVAGYMRQGLEWIVGHLDSFFSGFFKVLLALLIMFIALFYLLRDGGRLRERFLFLSPLSNKYDIDILGKLELAFNSVIRGSLTIAMIQGVLTTVGFYIFGVPDAVLWGLVAMVASLIPGVGTALVIIPAIIVLLVMGHAGGAIGLMLWGGLAVGLVDNFLSPYLINRGVNIHPFLILISVLGGIAFFGPIGFLAGPVVLSLFFALLDIYPILIAHAHEHIQESN